MREVFSRENLSTGQASQLARLHVSLAWQSVSYQTDWMSYKQELDSRASSPLEEEEIVLIL